MSKPSLRNLKRQAKEQYGLMRGLLRSHRKRVNEAVSAEIETALDALKTKRKSATQEELQILLDDAGRLYEAHLAQYRKNAFREFFEPIIVALAVALVLRAFVIEAFRIPSSSMVPTLAVGDFLFVNKLAYGVRMPYATSLTAEWSAPGRGDVIVFVYPCNDAYDYIKRVAAVPGDTVSWDVAGFVTIRKKGGELVQYTETAPKPFFDLIDEYKGGEVVQVDAATGAMSIPVNGCRANPQSISVYRAEVDTNQFNTLHCGVYTPQPKPASAGFDWVKDGAGHTLSCRQQRDRTGKITQEQKGRLMVPRAPWVVPDGHVFVMGDNRDNSQDSRYWGFVPVGLIKGKAMFLWMSWDGRGELPIYRKIRWNRLFNSVHRLMD
jgi:signal peptidase I